MDLIKDRRSVVIGNVWQGFGGLFELIQEVGGWIVVRNIAIELHDSECRSAFLLRYLNMITIFLVRASSGYAEIWHVKNMSQVGGNSQG